MTNRQKAKIAKRNAKIAMGFAYGSLGFLVVAMAMISAIQF